MESFENDLNLALTLLAALQDSNGDRLRTELEEIEALLLGWIRWPKDASLLWDGCVRMSAPYVYPGLLQRRIPHGVIMDRRMNNGPGRTAFHAGGGSCPEGWMCHHIYDRWYSPWPREGKPLVGGAVAVGRHFTQSAGIAAVHPTVNIDAHGDTTVSRFLKLLAFLKFGYDPEQRFGDKTDDYGFESGHRCKVLYP
jgi:hypothetical protein